MRGGVDRLTLCRDTLAAIHRQEKDVKMLEGLKPKGDTECAVIAAQLTMSRTVLRGLRLLWPERVGMAAEALQGISEHEHRVLWMNFALGMTAREIAREMKVSVRWVMRVKARGLEMLEEAEGEASDACTLPRG